MPEHKRKHHTFRDLYKIPEKEDQTANYCKLIVVIVISVVFIGGQIIGGIISHSISVISDATHLITDLIGFVVSFAFIYFSSKQSNKKTSFGFHRLQVIGALLNLFIIWFMAIFLFYEATVRIIQKQFVQSPKTMLIVAGGGLIVNIIMYFVLHNWGKHSHGLGQKCRDHDHQGQGRENVCNSCLQPLQQNQHVCIRQSSEHIQDENKKTQIIDKTIQNRQISIELKEIPVLEQRKNNSMHNHSHDHPRQHQQNLKGKSQTLNSHLQNPNKTHLDSKIKNQLQIRHQHQHPHPHHQHQHQHDHHQHQHQHDPQQGSQQGLKSKQQHKHHHQSLAAKESISMKAALLHALTDIIQSIGLLISSLVIFFLGSDFGSPVTEYNNWHLLDPLSTYLFSLLVVASTWPITKQCYHIILQSTPEEIDSEKLQQKFRTYEGVKQIHDFHIWQLRPGKILLTAHVFSQKGKQKFVLQKLTVICRKLKIYHTTIQVEQWQQKHKEGYIRCDHDIH